MNNREKLQKVLEEFSSGTFFTPVVGAEVEFYLVPHEVRPDGVCNPFRTFMSIRNKEDMNMRKGLQTPSCQGRIQEGLLLPWGEGWDEGAEANQLTRSLIEPLSTPHPNPLPTGEGTPSLQHSSIIAKIEQSCAHLSLFDVKKEEGDGQYEIAFMHQNEPVLLADRIIEARKIIGELAVEVGARADFSAKPFADDYGNSLHIHISLLDKNGKNPFEKQGDSESQIMLYAIGGLLVKMPESMPVFAPYPACYDRLKGGKDAPATISWGGNNRTVALRLPTTTTEPHNRRIEHRVAAADADPYAVIADILQGIRYGIENKILPQVEKTYGDASLPLYGLERISEKAKERKGEKERVE